MEHVKRQALQQDLCACVRTCTQASSVSHSLLCANPTRVVLVGFAHSWAQHSHVFAHWRGEAGFVSKVSTLFIYGCTDLCFPSLCPTDIAITVPSFAGSSYIAYPPITGATTSLTISISFNPSAPTGILIFTSSTDTDFADYTFVALINGYVHYGFNLGDGDALITSTDPVALGLWHTVTVSRIELTGSLVVDGSSPLFASSLPPFTGLNVGSRLYLGGHISFIDISSVVGTAQGFSGCVSSVSINSQDLDLILAADNGYGIGMCNVSLCAGDPCLNGGVCVEVGPTFICECTAEYTGPLCGTQIDPCAGTPCADGATCQAHISGVDFTCICPLGRGGRLCDEG